MQSGVQLQRVSGDLDPAIEETMARRNNIGILEDVYKLATVLPWWVGTILAIVVYGVLHWYAAPDVPTKVAPGQFGQMFVGQMLKTMAGIGQYIVPPFLLAGAVMSFFGRRKREGLVRAVGNGKPGNALRDVNWRDFEMLVGEAFRMRGFSAAETGGGGADGGIDLKLKKGGETFLVQCKQWRAYKVSVNIVRELFGVMSAQGATGGFVVTSGIFTDDAQSFAEGRNIELVDGQALTAMIEEVRAARLTATPVGKDPNWEASQVPATPTGAPTCPRCGSVMVKRIAKQGSNAGNAFWGCPAFPKCRGMRAIE